MAQSFHGTIADLSDDQLRHLILVKLSADEGVNAWGANRAELMELASKNGIWRLNQEDLQEVGPAEENQDTARFRKQLKSQMRARKERQQVGLSYSAKMYIQLLLLMVYVLVQREWIPLKRWLGRGQPQCPAPQWWQWSLPARFQPGSMGECVPG
jgi:hypothetical protein